MFKSINITMAASSIENGVVKIYRVLEMKPFDFNNLTLYVINHTTNSITLTSCSMRRSQDIASSQIGESIGWSIALNKVVAYLDGCEVYYDGEEEPIKMWWVEDEDGNFSGVNVDNERLIKFERKNEILLD